MALLSRRTMLMVMVLAPLMAAGLFGVARRHPHRACAPQAVPLVGVIDVRIVPEDSGIVASRRYPGIFWTHGDSGTEAAITAITRDGRIVGRFRVDAPNDDWEDIAADDAGHLYIAATGNNSGRREKAALLQLDEPDPRAGPATLTSRVWQLLYPDRPFNCEALFVHGGKGYLISKNAGGGPATLYCAPLDEAHARVTLRPLATLPVFSPVTAADMSPDGSRVAVLSTTELCIFRVDGEVMRMPATEPERIHLATPNRLEGCCFAVDGILVTSENGEVYLFPEEASRPSSANSDE